LLNVGSCLVLVIKTWRVCFEFLECFQFNLVEYWIGMRPESGIEILMYTVQFRVVPDTDSDAGYLKTGSLSGRISSSSRISGSWKGLIPYIRPNNKISQSLIWISGRISGTTQVQCTCVHRDNSDEKATICS